MKKKSFLLTILLSTTVLLSAQKFKLASGSLSPLKGETAMNVQFKYDNMTVGKKSEAQYLIDKTAEYNNKETGRGDSWAEKWVTDREQLFEPKFIELFNEYGKIKLVDEPQKYTLIFHTTFTEPGWNIHISRKNAIINGVATIVETENPSKIIAKIDVNKAPGRTFGGYDYATGERISEAYAVTGKKLPGFIEKNRKK